MLPTAPFSAIRKVSSATNIRTAQSPKLTRRTGKINFKIWDKRKTYEETELSCISDVWVRNESTDILWQSIGNMRSWTSMPLLDPQPHQISLQGYVYIVPKSLPFQSAEYKSKFKLCTRRPTAPYKSNYVPQLWIAPVNLILRSYSNETWTRAIFRKEWYMCDATGIKCPRKVWRNAIINLSYSEVFCETIFRIRSTVWQWRLKPQVWRICAK